MHTMNLSIRFNPELGVEEYKDAEGRVARPGKPGNLFEPAFRLIRYDDAWRPLASQAEVTGNGTAEVTATFRETYGGPAAFGRPADVVFPRYWPATFDDFPYAGDFRFVEPMPFAGEVRVRAVAAGRAEGLEFTIAVRDVRAPGKAYAQDVIRMPVGVEIPLAGRTRVYGTCDQFCHGGHDPREFDTELADPAFPRAWHYLEAELFGLWKPAPGIVENADPSELPDRTHAAAPLAVFQPEGSCWWGVAGESDYGATTLWHENRVRHFTTLYLKPAGSAEWTFVLWRRQAADPTDLVLDATLPKGFFDAMNPLGFEPKGAPAGPIVFGCYSRMRFQLEEFRKLRPGLVFINYHYDHISSTANLYGTWRNYEGYTMREEELRAFIQTLKGMGAKVGVYGTQVEQPESHRAVRQEDFVLDAWGRRWHAWEPGNWVVDAGNGDCADRLARAEAEFCRHYGLDAVFVDRLDHMGVNRNPRRKPGAGRLELVPSVRLGVVELNRARMKWQRQLNPGLYVGLNNTTCWAGVRHSDFNLLEGGDEVRRPFQSFLYQPNGVVNKRHFACLFGTFAGLSLFQAIGGGSQADFVTEVRRMIGRSLLSGVIAQPYGDELFVDRKSMFFQEGRDKDMPDAEKDKILREIAYHGGAEWRAMWDEVRPALDAAATLATPVTRIWRRPEAGSVPEACRFHARGGAGGGLYVALENASGAAVKVAFRVGGHEFTGEVTAGATRAWWFDPGAGGIQSVMFRWNDKA